MSEGRILLVDDETVVRTYVGIALKRSGFEIVEACNGHEALEIVKSDIRGFDLLLTDVRMPGMDGTELARIVSERHPAIPVLYISGYPLDFEAEQKKYKSCGFVQKPFVPADLLKAVRKCIGSNSGELQRTAVS
ncbi:MAG: response regulator [Bryobacteraceae bacterium]